MSSDLSTVEQRTAAPPHRTGHRNESPSAGPRWHTRCVPTAPEHRIETEAQLRDLIGRPAEIVCSKVTDRLNPLTRRYIERSPFLCIATSDPDGNCDLSPRGDPAGFVQVLDDVTLLLPERPGNRIADTLRNVLANPHVGLLFLVPGVTETFRVNGRASLTTDPELLSAVRRVLSAFVRAGWPAALVLSSRLSDAFR